MLVALDLNDRQAARVIAQALQSEARLEIEPRPDQFDALLWGTLKGRENDVLRIDLYDRGHAGPLGALVGAMADVRTILSEQLYLFSTFIVDADEGGVPTRLCLAVPELIQVANRRCFVRQTPTEPIPVRISLHATNEPFVANLADLGHGGLRMRIARKPLDDILFIGDPVHVEFALPWTTGVFSLPAFVCVKSPGPDESTLHVGVEFTDSPDGSTAPVLERLRAALLSESARLTGMNGDL